MTTTPTLTREQLIESLIRLYGPDNPAAFRKTVETWSNDRLRQEMADAELYRREEDFHAEQTEKTK